MPFKSPLELARNFIEQHKDYKKTKPDPSRYIAVRKGEFSDDEIKSGLKEEMGYSKHQAKRAVKDYNKEQSKLEKVEDK